jgi:hypothetical protein
VTLEQQVIEVVAEIRTTRQEFAQLAADAVCIAIERPEDKATIKEQLESMTARLTSLDAKLQQLQQQLTGDPR